MKILRRIISLPPMLVICCLGAFAALIGWRWLEDKCIGQFPGNGL